jgi:hypothetical protein
MPRKFNRFFLSSKKIQHPENSTDFFLSSKKIQQATTHRLVVYLARPAFQLPRINNWRTG